AVADLAGTTASSVYGIVGLVSKKAFRNAVFQLLNTGDYADGVSVIKSQGKYEVSLYLVVSSDVKIAEVVYEVQKQVSYVLTKNFGINFKAVNVYIQAVK
ncbi:MAG: Asp23/Gls24 family envelope stress response protein, partial [Bacilli bacterium]